MLRYCETAGSRRWKIWPSRSALPCLELRLALFPLTEGGWTLAWAALVNIDPGAARAVAQLLQDRERKARMFETLARGGPVTRFREIGVQILAGDGAVYTLGSHDSIAETDASRLLGPLAGAKAMIPDFVELAFQNDFWPTAAAHAAVVAQNGS